MTAPAPSAEAINRRILHAAARLRAAMPEAQYKATARAIKQRYESNPQAGLFELRFALAKHLATIGQIFPVVPECKRPLSANGVKDATQDLIVIREWVRRLPNCNWGITANVADVDSAIKPGNTKSGLDTFASIATEHGEPDTYSVVTPSGGSHFYITEDLPNAANTLGEGIDSRATGLGYVVAAGSHVTESPAERVAATGFYKVTNHKPIQSVPWLAALKGDYRSSVSRGDEVENPEAAISPELLAEALAALDVTKFREQEKWFRLMCSCHHATAGQGFPEFEAWSLSDTGYSGDTSNIEARWNSLHVHASGDLDMESDGGLVWHLRKIGRNDLVGKLVGDAEGFTSESFTEPNRESENAKAYDDADSEQPQQAANDNKRRNRLKGRSITELLKLKEPLWIVNAMVPDGLVVCYGKPKRGKSFRALDLSLCVATGKDFHGEKIGKTGRVLYVAAEGGAAAVRNRVLAWCKANDVDPKSLEGKWELVDTGIALNLPESVKEFLEVNRDGGKCALIVLDTLARNTRGDENSAKDMSMAIKGCDMIRETTGAAVMLVHHEGWSAKRIRGSSVLQGAPDAVIRVARDRDDYTTVIAEDMRESAAGKSQIFKLGTDGVLHMVAAAEAARRETGDRVLDILADLEGEHDGKVPLAAWRDAVKDAGLVDTSTSGGRMKWKRTVDAMVMAKRVKEHKGDRYSLIAKRDDLADDAPITDFVDDPIGDDADAE